MSQKNHADVIRSLSQRVVDAQRPIRILDAIQWDMSVREAFFATDCKEMPKVDVGSYESRALGFELEDKRAEFAGIARDCSRELGQFNAAGQLLKKSCDEYQQVCDLLESRGRPEFSNICRQLFGSAGDSFHAGDPSLADLGQSLGGMLDQFTNHPALPEEPKDIGGEEAVIILQERLDAVLPVAPGTMKVKLSDGIVADAAAGADYLKIRREARFNMRDLRLLEVHEGWVHLGTTLNGQQQSVCQFLSKGTPSATVTQEGLAVLMEIITLSSYPARVRRVTQRITAVHMAEEGADFLEVFRWYLEQGLSKEIAWTNTTRVFRGSLPNAGPFTKDISYSKGFVQLYNFMRLAVKRGALDRLQLLFVGKLRLEDIGLLAELRDEGLIDPPNFLPPQFADLNGLVAWMCYSNFLNRLNLASADADYARLF